MANGNGKVPPEMLPEVREMTHPPVPSVRNDAGALMRSRSKEWAQPHHRDSDIHAVEPIEPPDPHIHASLSVIADNKTIEIDVSSLSDALENNLTSLADIVKTLAYGPLDQLVSEINSCRTNENDAPPLTKRTLWNWAVKRHEGGFDKKKKKDQPEGEKSPE